ncbi:MAG: hypothetical protein EYC68_20000 [Chloroflexota bacterium]|nr:MAG: hypothetical protein EYC68_20000 [Chloroflexota bacterium]
MPDIPIAREFRQEILGPLTGKLKDGNCSALVGVGSSGKSNVVRHLLREDVRVSYFGEEGTRRLLYLYIDLDGLQNYTEHTAYAKLLSTLVEGLPQLHADTQQLEKELDAQWREVISTSSEILAREYLARALKHVLREYAERIIFVLDDCDRLIAKVDDAFLRGLRALRNDHKGGLMFATVSRKELQQLRAPSPDLQTFFELFSAHPIFVGPYIETDALGMLARLVGRQNEAARPLNQNEVARILELSGKHAGLIGAVYQVTNRFRDAYAVDLMASNVVDSLMGKKLVRAECEKIWESLPSGEVNALEELARGDKPTGASSQVLKRKGLIVENVDGHLAFFSPLLREFVKRGNAVSRENAAENVTTRPDDAHASAPSASPPPLRLDHSTKTIVVGETRITLSAVDFELIRVLWHKMPQPCRAEELVTHLVLFESTDAPYERLDAHLNEMNQLIQNTGLKILKSPDGQYHLEQ